MRYSELTERQRKLIVLSHEIGFGQLEFITIKDGEAFFTEQSRKVSTIRFAGEDQKKQSSSRPDGDFILKQEQLSLLAMIRDKKDGVIRQIRIMNGLPIDMVMAEAITI
jgi:hypothetical protein